MKLEVGGVRNDEERENDTQADLQMRSVSITDLFPLTVLLAVGDTDYVIRIYVHRCWF